MLREKYWGAWCRHCQTMVFRGEVFRRMGFPFCSECSHGIDDLHPFEWIPPLNGDGILRVWDEAFG